MTGQAGRADYDFTSRVGTAAPGEPYFILRGSDVVAGETIRVWASLAAAKKTPPEALELALQQADAIDRWPIKKVPKGPDLTDAERRQLIYQHGRRAWEARNEVATIYPLLADRLAQDAIAGKLRPILSDLLTSGAIDKSAVETDPDHPFHKLFSLAGWNLSSRLAPEPAKLMDADK